MRNTAVREDVRELILDTADRLMERYGYRKMTVDDIAQDAGIGKGTIYLHFRSKEDLALSWAERLNQGVQSRLLAIAGGSGSPVERLQKMLVMRVLLRFDSCGRYASSLDDLLAALRPQLRKLRERWLEAEAQIVAEVLIEGRLLGTFAVEDAVLTAHSLLLATNALLPFSLSPQELGSREEIETRASRIVDILLKGLLKRDDPAQP